MPKCTVTKVFTVDAASKQEAVQKVTDEPGELLGYVSVFLQSDGIFGWKASVREQLIGA